VDLPLGAEARTQQAVRSLVDDRDASSLLRQLEGCADAGQPGPEHDDARAHHRALHMIPLASVHDSYIAAVP
jgi:hypothetical protein